MEAPNISTVERLTLSNQFKILAKLDEQNADEHQRKADILDRGLEGYYDEVFSELSDPIPQGVYDETLDILNMMETIENAIEALPPTEREENKEALDRIAFKGFDGNHDSHYLVMKWMMANDDRYTRFNERYINSHTRTSIGRYRAMLPAFQRLAQVGHVLSLTELLTISESA